MKFKIKKRLNSPSPPSAKMSGQVFYLVPFSKCNLTNSDAEDLTREFLNKLKPGIIDQWGFLHVKDENLYGLVPWSQADQFKDHPILFFDDTRNVSSHTTIFGVLGYAEIRIYQTVGNYLQKLLSLSKTVSKLWPKDQPPPRLHLRELYPTEARAKTNWRCLSEDQVQEFIRMVIALIRKYSNTQILLPLQEKKLQRAIAEPHFESAPFFSLPDLALQLTAFGFQAALHQIFHSLPINTVFEVIADHNKTPVQVSKQQKRQTTLRFLERLNAFPKSVVNNPEIKWDPLRRYSSYFPQDFTREHLEANGYPMRPLAEALGIQLVDVYLGLWKQLHYQGRSLVNIQLEDLGTPLVKEMVWMHEQKASP